MWVGFLAIEGDISARIRQERARIGLSQVDFAQRVGVGRSSQKDYESGATSPSAEYLLKARDLGVDVVFVLTGTGTANEISAAEYRLLQAFRGIDGERQEAVLRLVELMQPPATAPPGSSDAASTQNAVSIREKAGLDRSTHS